MNSCSNPTSTTGPPLSSTATTTSAGGASSSTSLSTDLVSLFECPVCFDYALPPIMQCHSGHIVCSACREKLTTCPTCRATLDNIRNLAMEKLAMNVQFPCKYAAIGCTGVFSYNQKVEHEEVCEHRPYMCPCPGASCKWSGSLDQVMAHLLSQHKSITTLQGEDIVFLATDINLPGAIDWVMMQSCFGHNFMLVLEKQVRQYLVNRSAVGGNGGGQGEGLRDAAFPGDRQRGSLGSANTATVGPLGFNVVANTPSVSGGDLGNAAGGGQQHLPNLMSMENAVQHVEQFHAVVQIIGSRKVAEQFAYRLELNGPRRRLSWEATPGSIHDGVQASIASCDCLLFDSSMANLFAENGNLGINVTIMQSSTAPTANTSVSLAHFV